MIFLFTLGGSAFIVGDQTAEEDELRSEKAQVYFALSSEKERTQKKKKKKQSKRLFTNRCFVV